MDQELKGITDFLVGRAKVHLQTHFTMCKIYFIIRNHHKIKLVYSPVDCEDIIESAELHLLPVRIQNKWLERRITDPVGTELVAVVVIYTCLYVPNNRNMPNFGRTAIATTINMKDDHEAFMIFFKRSRLGVEFDPEIVYVPNNEGVLKYLYPKIV